jgi:hypothetical protein
MYCVCLELRPLPSIGITRFQRYCEPLRHPKRPACTLALSPIRDTLSEGFSYLVTSIAAPAASGWRVSRVGLAPTGKRRLVTAHTVAVIPQLPVPGFARAYERPLVL